MTRETNSRPSGQAPRLLSRLGTQARFDLLAFARNPAAAFFTVVLPLIFLFLFTGLFGNQVIDERNGVRAATVYVPGLLALAIVSATFVNVAMTTVNRREDGLLKRVRGTPLPPRVFLAAQVVAAVVLVAFMAVVVVGIGRLIFDVSLPLGGLVPLVVTLVVGSASFCVLGLAVCAVIPSNEAASAITNAIVLPLYFVSDVFLITDAAPGWLRRVGDLFPVKHLSQALFSSFDPFNGHSVADWPFGHWLVILAWGAVGAAIALRTFRWTPWGS